MLAKLPTEILLLIANEYLTFSDLWRLSGTSRFLRAVAVSSMRSSFCVDLERDDTYVSWLRGVLILLAEPSLAQDDETVNVIGAYVCRTMANFSENTMASIVPPLGELANKSLLEKTLETTIQHAVFTDPPRTSSSKSLQASISQASPQASFLTFMVSLHKYTQTTSSAAVGTKIRPGFFCSTLCRAFLTTLQHPPNTLSYLSELTHTQRSLESLEKIYSLVAGLYAHRLLTSDYLFILTTYISALLSTSSSSLHLAVDGFLAEPEKHDPSFKVRLNTHITILRGLLTTVGENIRKHQEDATHVINLVQFLRKETRKIHNVWLGVVKREQERKIREVEAFLADLQLKYYDRTPLLDQA